MKKSKVQVIFSLADPLGLQAGADRNFWEHMDKSVPRSDKDVNRYFPRGKAYWRLVGLQIDQHVEVVYDDQL